MIAATARGNRPIVLTGTVPAIQAAMPIALEEEPGNVFRVEIRGMLRKAELDRCQAELAG